MASTAEFDALFERYQAEQALPGDRASKAVSTVLWAAVAAKQLAHGYRREAALSLIAPLLNSAFLASGYWQREAYLRNCHLFTAIAFLQAHLVAAAISVADAHILAGRHSANPLRFLFVMALYNTGLFQAFAALNSWPMLGSYWLLAVQMPSAAAVAARMRGICQVVLETDPGAPKIFNFSHWLLRQVFSLVDTTAPWDNSSQAVAETECMQLNIWWLIMCVATSLYTCWRREQRARERFARQLGPAGLPHLRRMMQRHPMHSHGKPLYVVAIELYALAAVIWEVVRAILPGLPPSTPAGPGVGAPC